MNYTPFIILLFIIAMGVVISLDRISNSTKQLQIELNKPDTVYLQKINDTTFQKRNITYIIR